MAVAAAVPAASVRRVAVASAIGTTIEWYDFFLYGTAAALVFPALFFPQADPFTGQILAFSTFTIGFLARPLGGVVFGAMGDRLGRKAALVATLLLMGSVCTRACRFCAVDTGNPRGWLDPDEPANAARTVALMGLGYVVLTSVDRDDLPDGGAAHLAACVRAIKQANPKTAVEALTPDFQGVRADVETVVDSGIEVFAQNVETVERLTHPVRDPRAGYRQTLDVLAHAKRHRPGVLTKTSLMLGLGETDEEVVATMDDLRAIGCDILTLGQYLRPTPNHLPVERYVTPESFLALREAALARGFLECVSGPMVRSSYRAEQALAGNNCGLGAG